MLVATGVPLIWLYRPEAAGANRQLGAELPSDRWHWLTTVHRLSSIAFLVTALVLLTLVLVTRATRGRWPWAAGLVVVALVAAISGYRLPWDQLAVWAVTVGTDLRGVFAPFRGEVRFIMRGGEISKGEYLRPLLVHLAAVPLLALAGGLAFRRSVRRAISRQPT